MKTTTWKMSEAMSALAALKDAREYLSYVRENNPDFYEDGGIVERLDAAIEAQAEISVNVMGVGRMFDNERALLVVFKGKPTDDDIRAVHERLR